MRKKLVTGLALIFGGILIVLIWAYVTASWSVEQNTEVIIGLSFGAFVVVVGVVFLTLYFISRWSRRK